MEVKAGFAGQYNDKIKEEVKEMKMLSLRFVQQLVQIQFQYHL
ncbi:UNVERIFIED_ORG: hypothetical protein [Escherichia phage CMSTMSU]